MFCVLLKKAAGSYAGNAIKKKESTFLAVHARRVDCMDSPPAGPLYTVAGHLKLDLVTKRMGPASYVELFHMPVVFCTGSCSDM